MARMRLNADVMEGKMKSVKGMLAGDTGLLSRLISLVERDDPEVPHIMREIYPPDGESILHWYYRSPEKRQEHHY
jgi:hypothetical protein